MSELEQFQNLDGGFGNALEPDIRNLTSSVLTTTVGLQYADFARIPTDHPLIEKAIKYLIDNFREDKIYWPSTNLDVMDNPHAPWWDVSEIKEPDEDEWANPNVEVIGYLNRYNNFADEIIINKCNAYLDNYLDTHPKLTGFIFYKFFCWKRSMPHLPDPISKKVFTLIDSTFSKEIMDTTDFNELKIQTFVTEPSSYLNMKYPSEVDLLVKAEINRQNEDGGWYPTWSWGDDPELKEKVKMEWAGKITVEFLMLLKYLNL